MTNPHSFISRWITACLMVVMLLPVAGNGVRAGTQVRLAQAAFPEAIIYYDQDEKAIAFSAGHLKNILESKGTDVTLKALDELPEERSGCYIILANTEDAIVAELLKDNCKAPRMQNEQDYAIRVTRLKSRNGYWVLGGDRIGTMYGGIHIAEIVAGGSLLDVRHEDQSPYIAKRGLKFNIPLDSRTPSFGDNGDSHHSNRGNVWDLAFWREYLDTIALQRYNVLSLWNKHPFPSLVKVPDYPDVAIQDVQDNKGEVIKTMTIEEKIEFWNKVLELAHARGIEMWFMVWNVELHGAEGKYGITTEKDNEITKDYLRKSVVQYFLTYPRMAGIGSTTGEKMKQFDSDSEKEQWIWDTYGEAVMDVKKLQPDRKIRFVHRHWLTDWDEIGKRFDKLPDGFEMGLKYAQARLYSSYDPSWPFRQLDKIPEDMATWWNLRNDDIFIQRWGDPEYVRQYILHFPNGGPEFTKSPRLTAGYVMGSDRYLWARDSMSKNPADPRKLELERHWYKFLLWGRLGYDPNTPDDLFKGLIQYRFPTVDSTKVFDAWQAASRIIPTVNRFHFWPWDFHWWVEKGTSTGHLKSIAGYHNVDHVIVNETHEVSDYNTIEKHVAGEGSGASPLVVADSLEFNAEAALQGVTSMEDRGNIELRETLGDIRSQAYFGLYWANKIRGAYELALFRKNKDPKNKEAAVAFLTKSYEEWMRYADQLDASYEKVRFAAHGVFDWYEVAEEVKKDIEIARLAE